MIHATLPTITRQALETASEDAAALVYLLISEYHQIIAADTTGQVQHSFSDQQNILMAYEVFDAQVCNGGFLQLIENGYGSYIFDTPVGDLLASWGLTRTADLIARARPLYLLKKEELEREKTLAEFARLYQLHPDFDPLDKEYYEIADSEKEIMKIYILANLDKFAVIK